MTELQRRLGVGQDRCYEPLGALTVDKSRSSVGRWARRQRVFNATGALAVFSVFDQPLP
jgi:hypothetical protein